MEGDTGSGDPLEGNTPRPAETSTWATLEPLDVPYNERTTAFLLVGLFVLVGCGVWLIFWVRARQNRIAGQRGIDEALVQRDEAFNPVYLEPETGLSITSTA